MSGDQATKLRQIKDGRAGFGVKPRALPSRLLTAERQARTIAVASGKGGVGKTNLTVNLGLALARLGQRVTIVDLDLGLANIDVVLGITAKLTLREVLRGQCAMEEAIVEGPHGLRLVCGGSGIAELANLDQDHREELIEALSVVDQTSDIVLLDVGAGISSTVLDFVAAAGETLVLTTTEPTAMTDAYALIKVVSRYARGTQFNLVVNQMRDVKEAQEVALTMTGVAQRFLNVELNTIGFLPYDDKLPAAVKRRTPILLAYPGSRFATAIEQLAGRLVARPAATAQAERPATSFARFLRRLSGRAV